MYTNGFTRHDDESDDKPLRILLFAESFPSFTSGVVRRFKEIVRRLAYKRHHVHVITGCNVSCPERLKNYPNNSIYFYSECLCMDQGK